MEKYILYISLALSIGSIIFSFSQLSTKQIDKKV